MKQQYTNLSGKGWLSMVVSATLLLVGNLTQAQEGSQGNTTIFGGAQMTFFSNHNFVTGGGGAQPGVILTDRAAGNFGILNFAGDNLTSTGASDAGYVDGYVRKYGAGQFTFPVGDNGFVGQFAASADGVMGAYFHADANTAVTSNLFTGSNYAPLPTGGPFPTSSMGTNVDVVSTIEYWDIDGTNATPLTLTWDAGSAIGTLTTNQLIKLSIVGWDGTQWVAIPSKVDVTSILGGTSDLTAGSITTVSPLAPNTFTAYTFASLVLPLPVTLTRFTAVAEGKTALLAWTTTEETNSDRFDIERSPNGKQWSKIASVSSQGDSKVLINYSYADASPLTGQNFYRLKMIDRGSDGMDGMFAYSQIRKVAFENKADLAPYPNPAVEKILIRSHELVKQVDILSTNGEKVIGNQHPSSAGIDVAKLPQGIYIISITLFDGTISTHKIAVTRQ